MKKLVNKTKTFKSSRVSKLIKKQTKSHPRPRMRWRSVCSALEQTSHSKSILNLQSSQRRSGWVFLLHKPFSCGQYQYLFRVFPSSSSDNSQIVSNISQSSRTTVRLVVESIKLVRKTNPKRKRRDQDVFKKPQNYLKVFLKSLRKVGRFKLKINVYEKKYQPTKVYLLLTLQLLSSLTDIVEMREFLMIFSRHCQEKIFYPEGQTQEIRQEHIKCYNNAMLAFEHFVNGELLTAFKVWYGYEQMRQKRHFYQALLIFHQERIKYGFSLDSEIELFLHQNSAKFKSKKSSIASIQSSESQSENIDESLEELIDKSFKGPSDVEDPFFDLDVGLCEFNGNQEEKEMLQIPEQTCFKPWDFFDEQLNLSGYESSDVMNYETVHYDSENSDTNNQQSAIESQRD